MTSDRAGCAPGRSIVPGSPSAAGRGRAFGLLITLVVATTSAVVLTSGEPVGATNTAAPIYSYSVVARYKAGAGYYQASTHRRWKPDTALAPGGRTITRRSGRLAHLGALYRSTRVGVTRYRVHVASPGRYRLVLRYPTCSTAACTVRTAMHDAALAHAGTLSITVPPWARTLGVATVTVERAGAKRSTPVASTPANPAPAQPTQDASANALLQPSDVTNATDLWRQNITNAPMDRASGAMAANLTSQITPYYGGVAALNAYRYNATWYNVGATQQTTTVSFNNCQHKTYTPPGLFGPSGQFVNVPIPSRAVPSPGSDATLTIYRRATDQLWSFWRTSRTATGWSACWGGRIDHVSTSPGYFAKGFGSSASGLASELGAVTISDVRSGSINHAMSLAIPYPATWKRVSWPAQRSDGYSTDPHAIPEGTRLRLDPSINVDALHLTPIATMIAKAAQKYGFIVTDQSGCVSVVAESGGPSQQATGVNPWDALLDGVPTYSALKNFPWRNIQAIQQNYGRP